MTDSLKGTTVLVTGAAGGLGKVIATAYLDAGANVAICDVNEERLAAARGELEPKGPFAAFKTDVTDEAAVTKLVEDVTARFGRLDILVSNAGMTDKFDPVGSLSKEHWDRILNLNLTGSFLAFKAAVNAMEAQSPPGGTIIQIGSAATTHGMASGVAYAVSPISLVLGLASTSRSLSFRGWRRLCDARLRALRSGSAALMRLAPLRTFLIPSSGEFLKVRRGTYILTPGLVGQQARCRSARQEHSWALRAERHLRCRAVAGRHDRHQHPGRLPGVGRLQPGGLRDEYCVPVQAGMGHST